MSGFTLCRTSSPGEIGSRGWWAIQGWPLSVEWYDYDGLSGWFVYSFTDDQDMPDPAAKQHRHPYTVPDYDVRVWLRENGLLVATEGDNFDFVFFATRSQALDALEMSLEHNPPSWEKR